MLERVHNRQRRGRGPKIADDGLLEPQGITREQERVHTQDNGRVAEPAIVRCGDCQHDEQVERGQQGSQRHRRPIPRARKRQLLLEEQFGDEQDQAGAQQLKFKGDVRFLHEGQGKE